MGLGGHGVNILGVAKLKKFFIFLILWEYGLGGHGVRGHGVRGHGVNILGVAKISIFVDTQ